ncbi:hypothetical protein LRS13_24010 [Svornostia abyssi]|uniref:DUF397 domain-containing protein n=1 Tax=Svornostia abyssi TaxID=2898438 RepID=A0ABY5PGJ0_9ACTN|nr:hypothetical protein LRS13_24010 [Parviterribacteraceae bacterium J379]
MCAPPPDGEFAPAGHVAGQRLDDPVTAPPGEVRVTRGWWSSLVIGWASASVTERSGQARAWRLRTGDRRLRQLRR